MADFFSGCLKIINYSSSGAQPYLTAKYVPGDKRQRSRSINSIFLYSVLFSVRALENTVDYHKRGR